ncbi:hypothetical protein [Chroococcus sp. FPU101]|uniref:hypothetical protein n=1 Tax=Chroococcus sp. FPU101 TaxID=1974212 RepID=UPI001A8D1EF0|nr:hypothetical protein [Chroococcus sp. FPU101]
MKKPQLINSLVACCISPITVFCFTTAANAQQFSIPEVETIGPQAMQFVQTCNQVINMAQANPNDANLQIYARNCSLHLYQYRLCLNQAALSFPPDVNFAAKCANSTLRFDD